MAGTTFGRKGMEAAAPVGRRAQYFTPPPVAVEDALDRRREAFIAAERARAGEAAEAADPMASAARAKEKGLPVFPGQKSARVAYSLWFFLGMISAHRFYLGRPITGVAQTCLWYVSLMFWMAGHELAFFPMVAGVSWLVADLLLIPGMTRAINEKLEAKAYAAEVVKVETTKAPETQA